MRQPKLRSVTCRPASGASKLRRGSLRRALRARLALVGFAFYSGPIPERLWDGRTLIAAVRAELTLE